MTVRIKNLDEMTIGELWAEVELWFSGIEGTARGRSYREDSCKGVRHIELQIREHLAHVDRLLLEIEMRNA